MKYVYDQGHQVASHTWSHPDLTTLNPTQIDTEFSRIELALKRLLGVTPKFMRPPYGSYNNNVREVAYKRGQKLVLWDFDSGDSTGSTASQSKKKYDDLVAKKPNNILALNHEVYSASLFFLGIALWTPIDRGHFTESTAYTVLPYAIKLLKANGYKLVTVAECLGTSPYQSVTSPQTVSPLYSCASPYFGSF